jgi:ribosomal-protein-alanine N-acetyltransferase
MLHLETIQTARLTLRRPRVTDAQAIYANYASDPEATRYLRWPPHTRIASVVSWLEALETTWHERSELSWTLRTAQDSEPIGMISLRVSEFKAELGYVLGRAHWGQGLMPEAARALIKLCFEERLYRVSAFCDVDNVQSARVMEKAGMVREGLLHRYVIHPNVSIEPRDVYLYATYR